MARKPKFKGWPEARPSPAPKLRQYTRGDLIQTRWGAVGSVEVIRAAWNLGPFEPDALVYMVRATASASTWIAGVLYEIPAESIVGAEL